MMILNKDNDGIPMNPVITLIAAIVILFISNYITQPYEDAVAYVAPETVFYLDWVWYLDDIIGPALFLTAAFAMLFRIRFNPKVWQLAGLGLACMAFALGDSFDAHWVFAEHGSAGQSEATASFSSWISKIMVVITFCFFIVYAYDGFERSAQKMLLFGFFLLFIDQAILSFSLDFAGYAFHVFEEALEVVTAAVFCFGAGCRRIYPERL